MPAPVPNNEAAENADGNFLWPDGKQEAAKHKSHVIVTNMGSGKSTPIQSAVTIAKLSLAALEIFDGIGVYWGNASVTNSRQVFEEFVAKKKECGEPTQGFTFDKFVQTLRKNKEAIVSKHGARSVRFTVYIKDGKAALKATPVKD